MRGEGVFRAILARLGFLRTQISGDPALLSWMETQETINAELLALVVALTERAEVLEERQSPCCCQPPD